MAKVKIQAGAEIDLLNKAELDDSLKQQGDADILARLRGLKHMRLPEVLSGTASSSKLSLDGNQSVYPLGPRAGYIWAVRRIVITGMTSGASPDVLNMYKGAPGAGAILWQFDGNHFGYTFGRLEMTLYGGEVLCFQSSGTFAATGLITVGGEVIEVPAELVGKLA